MGFPFLVSRFKAFVILAFLLIISLACRQDVKYSGPKFSDKPLAEAIPLYSFAVHPLHNPAKLIQSYQPLIDYLNMNVKGAQFYLEASRDYANFESKYRKKTPEFLLPNPIQTIDAMKYGYNVIAMAGEPNDFKGLFIVRKDSRILEPSDLIGKSISYPSSTALAACIMPQYFLYKHGIDVNKDITNRYVGSQESSIMNVNLKNTDAGATWPTPWFSFLKDHPKEASQLKVIWQTESLINNSVMVRSDVPDSIQMKVCSLLLHLNSTEKGQNILSNMFVSHFILSHNEDYEIARKYIEIFQKEVRPVFNQHQQ
ncbi:MAG: PhnD/SsuA/transferrin family substrate-binding protein [Bacteroidales bacterium]|nr:PhnD/SsuA/transferrin family substrate-binding protein [Bacteroidales bacterium]